jgi:methylated-DNA-[protein]-cysteine S-methyltransferase
MSEKIVTQVFNSPVGALRLGVFNNELCLCDWQFRKQREAVDERVSSGLGAPFVAEEHPLHTEVIAQLNAYFAGRLQRFDLPLAMVGSDFQQQVWKFLLDIPYGNTRSYLQLSRQLGNEKAIRAVAAANGANALSIVVPCHRIIGSDGSLTGYAGGLQAKKKLLTLEGVGGQMELF